MTTKKRPKIEYLDAADGFKVKSAEYISRNGNLILVRDEKGEERYLAPFEVLEQLDQHVDQQ